MQLTLEQGELELLRSVLDRALGDLRMEVGKTENFAMRNSLKQDEVLLKAIIDRLAPAQAKG
ncbi:MAG: hypothetical protein HYX53_16135 [Chloroflexi bacterium]|nr:hypothetical protein [Chloroflexota bacterium]